MTRLVANTVVLNPETSAPVVLTAGDELPPWGVGRVGGHLLTDDAPDAETPDEAPATEPKPRARRTSKD